jgi:hypothetical protein
MKSTLIRILVLSTVVGLPASAFPQPAPPTDPGGRKGGTVENERNAAATDSTGAQKAAPRASGGKARAAPDHGGRKGGTVEDERKLSTTDAPKTKGDVVGAKDQVPEDSGGKKGGKPETAGPGKPKKPSTTESPEVPKKT